MPYTAFDFTGTSQVVVNPTSMPNGGTNLLANQLIHIYSFTLSVAGATKITIKDQTGQVLWNGNFGAASTIPFAYTEGRDPALGPATPGSGIVIASSNSVEVIGSLNFAIRGFP